MKITERDAAEHIVNSLDNEHGSWYDVENKVTWHIRSGGPGVVTIALINEDDEEEVHNFSLVWE